MGDEKLPVNVYEAKSMDAEIEILPSDIDNAIWDAAIEAAAKGTREFQDIIGWQEGESRNELIGDIERKIRALKREPS